MVWPVRYGDDVVRVLSIDTSAEVESGTIFVDWFEFTLSAVAWAVFVTCAFETSVGVTMYVAVQVIDSPGSRKLSRSPTVVTAGQVTVARLSDTVTGPASGAKPLLVTR